MSRGRVFSGLPPHGRPTAANAILFPGGRRSSGECTRWRARARSAGEPSRLAGGTRWQKKEMQVERVQPSTQRPSDELRETSTAGYPGEHPAPPHPAGSQAIPGPFERAETCWSGSRRAARNSRRKKPARAPCSISSTTRPLFSWEARRGARGPAARGDFRRCRAPGGPLAVAHDQLAVARRRARLIRIGIWAAIAAAIARPWFSSISASWPGPHPMAAYDHRGRAEDLAYNGDYEGALSKSTRGRPSSPPTANCLS